MNIRLLIALLLVASTASAGWAQSADDTDGAFGNIRTYILMEEQADPYRDSRSWALGGWLGYKKTLVPDLQTEVVFYHSERMWSMDLRKPDPTTGKLPRYTLGLYDVQHPGKPSISFIGRLNLTYSPGNHELTVGRMLPKTPFFNPEDGRMIPTLAQGVRYTYRPDNQFMGQVYFIQAVAPRSTGKWYTIGNSLGTYSAGLRSDGTPSQYAGNVDTDGLVIARFGWNYAQHGNVNLWNYRLTNVFNLAYFQGHQTIFTSNPWTVRASVEGFYQNGVGEGGSTQPDLRYIDPEAESWGLGARVAVIHQPLTFSLAGLRIGPAGRFLFPREWGREPFFVFQKRERAEGSGDTWVYYSALNYHQDRFNVKLSYAFQDRTSPAQAELNKYALGDYHQLNINIHRSWAVTDSNKLGLELLYTYKWNGMDKDIPLKAGWEYNKVNLHLYHLVLNYSF
ncbi:MAG: OprD family outer membrane porin [Bacteroidota bacterium]